MTRGLDIDRLATRSRRWLAALACALLLGQAFAVAHALDAEAHADDLSCQLCHVANPAGGAAPAIADLPVDSPTGTDPVAPLADAGPVSASIVLPPSRAPPASLAIS